MRPVDMLLELLALLCIAVLVAVVAVADRLESWPTRKDEQPEARDARRTLTAGHRGRPDWVRNWHHRNKSRP
jgi:hypothetical protein